MYLFSYFCPEKGNGINFFPQVFLLGLFGWLVGWFVGWLLGVFLNHLSITCRKRACILNPEKWTSASGHG